MDDKEHRLTHEGALRHQRFLRFITACSFGYPVVAFLGLLAGVLSFTTPIAASVAAMLVYHIHHQNFGNINKWWWLRRGTIVSIKSFLTIEETRRWIKESGYDYVEVMPGSFKFYRTSDAVHFKLVWS